MNCFSCNNFLPSVRNLYSNTSDIPLGLDRGPEVSVGVYSCDNCGCEIILDYELEESKKLYSQGSVCFEASKATTESAEINYPYSSNLMPKRLIRSIAGTKICDFGCGAGFVTEFLHNHGLDVIGCDIDPKAVSFLTSKGIDARKAGLEILDEVNFQTFICIGVIEHFKNPKKFLKEVASFQSINDLIILFPNLHAINKRASELLGGQWDMYLEPGHYTFYSKEALLKDLEEFDFDLELYWTTSHIGRGKLPLKRNRSLQVELKVLNTIIKNRVLFRLYKASFQILDLLKGGDIGCYWFKRDL